MCNLCHSCLWPAEVVGAASQPVVQVMRNRMRGQWQRCPLHSIFVEQASTFSRVQSVPLMLVSVSCRGGWPGRLAWCASREESCARAACPLDSILVERGSTSSSVVSLFAFTHSIYLHSWFIQFSFHSASVVPTLVYVLFTFFPGGGCEKQFLTFLIVLLLCGFYYC